MIPLQFFSGFKATKIDEEPLKSEPVGTQRRSTTRQPENVRILMFFV